MLLCVFNKQMTLKKKEAEKKNLSLNEYELEYDSASLIFSYSFPT
jgi:hypothetical protein